MTNPNSNSTPDIRVSGGTVGVQLNGFPRFRVLASSAGQIGLLLYMVAEFWVLFFSLDQLEVEGSRIVRRAVV